MVCCRDEEINRIVAAALASAQPYGAVYDALRGEEEFDAVIAIGKAASEMARAAADRYGKVPDRALIITKYGCAPEPPSGFRVIEAGHPVPDENSFAAADAALEAVRGLTESDRVLVLISGGGSAVFEKTEAGLCRLREVTSALLSRGASIDEMNCVRKHLSDVKGGRFALACAPARVVTLALSDVIGDSPDVIASGPTVPDGSTSGQAAEILARYGVDAAGIERLIERETPKELTNRSFKIIGGNALFREAAAREAGKLGYEVFEEKRPVTGEASDTGRMIARRAAGYSGARAAFVYSGETVVHIKGGGLGGRCQEAALAAAVELDGCADTVFAAFGSDGTDGPTDADGGFVDGTSCAAVKSATGAAASDLLADNDSHRALAACGGLIVTGATGTNVNDVYIALKR